MNEVAMIGVVGGLGVIAALAGATSLAAIVVGGLGLTWYAKRRA